MAPGLNECREYGLGKIKLKEGDLTELDKLIPTLSGLTDFSKKVLEGKK